MSKRDLSTSRRQVFGHASRGEDCRVCGRSVDDGRRAYCSEYCSDIATAVMDLLNWSSVRRRIIDRDDETCQRCGFDLERERHARDHIRHRIDEQLPETPDAPSVIDHDEIEEYDWDEHHETFQARREKKAELKAAYGDPWERDRDLHVDHVTPIVDGGHPFDPANLETLCECCHHEKTARENTERADRERQERPETPLTEFLLAGGAEKEHNEEDQ